ncbi:MAG: site-specific DNA-methyltransferase [Acidobacteria bacterium]|nr:site-specific DNA-methyltransferase [Acidobacteriota bacterium]MCA1640213.1 site-specific DNA-methyltransferase [Acidobacteriota bacterium]
MKPLQKLLYDPIKDFWVDENRWQGNISDKINWQVINGDSRDAILQFPANSFDCVITSPPYFWLRHYGVDNQIGLEETVNEYVEAISSVMDAVYSVLTPKGLLFLNLSDTYYSGKGQPKCDGQEKQETKLSLLL